MIVTISVTTTIENDEKAMQPQQDLIELMKRYKVTITLADIPDVMKLGADTFLLRLGMRVPEKELLAFYMILNELRS